MDGRLEVGVLVVGLNSRTNGLRVGILDVQVPFEGVKEGMGGLRGIDGEAIGGEILLELVEFVQGGVAEGQHFRSARMDWKELASWAGDVGETLA